MSMKHGMNHASLIKDDETCGIVAGGGQLLRDPSVDRIPVGSIIFEKSFAAFHSWDKEISSYIYSIQLGPLDNVVWLWGITVSLIWTTPGLFLPAAVLIVTPSTTFAVIAGACMALSLIQCIMAMTKGCGKFMVHAIAFAVYAPVVIWAAVEHTEKGEAVVCYFGSCVTCSLALFAPLKWEFDRERPIVSLKRAQEGSSDEEVPWEERRAFLFRRYILNIAGLGDPLLIHQANESFPSGDSATACAMAMALVFMTGHPAYFLFGIAVMLGRVYFMCHFIGDTIIGSMIGCIPPVLWQCLLGWESVTWQHLVVEIGMLLLILGPLFARHHSVKKQAISRMSEMREGHGEGSPPTLARELIQKSVPRPLVEDAEPMAGVGIVPVMGTVALGESTADPGVDQGPEVLVSQPGHCPGP